ncbi:hypothetical protein CBR_g20174 [Chara braunii]|uniref:Pectate lyase n=1 Tax=Chara braunii TaxID=69332 RepID=A0A388L015_CHABU|nr:hypothetical protein CBR_g20174 [Chara braunii]|eukprot:GBG75543.1 hypothetical protein CBR_g20174 [Chara braunii]
MKGSRKVRPAMNGMRAVEDIRTHSEISSPRKREVGVLVHHPLAWRVLLPDVPRVRGDSQVDSYLSSSLAQMDLASQALEDIRRGVEGGPCERDLREAWRSVADAKRASLQEQYVMAIASLSRAQTLSAMCLNALEADQYKGDILRGYTLPKGIYRLVQTVIEYIVNSKDFLIKTYEIVGGEMSQQQPQTNAAFRAPIADAAKSIADSRTAVNSPLLFEASKPTAMTGSPTVVRASVSPLTAAEVVVGNGHAKGNLSDLRLPAVFDAAKSIDDSLNPVLSMRDDAEPSGGGFRANSKAKTLGAGDAQFDDHQSSHSGASSAASNEMDGLAEDDDDAKNSALSKLLVSTLPDSKAKTLAAGHTQSDDRLSSHSVASSAASNTADGLAEEDDDAQNSGAMHWGIAAKSIRESNKASQSESTTQISQEMDKSPASGGDRQGPPVAGKDDHKNRKSEKNEDNTEDVDVEGPVRRWGGTGAGGGKRAPNKKDEKVVMARKHGDEYAWSRLSTATTDDHGDLPSHPSQNDASAVKARPGADTSATRPETPPGHGPVAGRTPPHPRNDTSHLERAANSDFSLRKPSEKPKPEDVKRNSDDEEENNWEGSKGNSSEEEEEEETETVSHKRKKPSKPEPDLGVHPEKGDFIVRNFVDECVKSKANIKGLADCGFGYGRNAQGGRGGEVYEVTSTADNPSKPAEGTLRYACQQERPLWIIFTEKVMNFKPIEQIKVSSHKTIDGRGSKVTITNAGLSLKGVKNVIIHNLIVEKCNDGTDMDAIHVEGSQHVWVNHLSLSESADGLADFTHQSTDVTISNCKLTNHDKGVLLGHDDSKVEDRDMRVTVSHNWFGPGLRQRMPRGRFGIIHVFNNLYSKWEIYALGGSAGFMSEGNYFDAGSSKGVTKLIGVGDVLNTAVFMSYGDALLNGARFENMSKTEKRPFDPAYPYKVLMPTQAMASMIENSAGWQDVPLPR